MNASLEQVKAVFLEAIDRCAPDQQSQFLNEACAGNQQLRQQVEILLEAHASGSLLDKGAMAGSPTLDQPITERPGTQIGPYKLRERIGEGGFGAVFVAEQEKPVARKVALKIIKAGMDTRAVVARFEAERQALALMDHPNIAKVLDAGATENGRPYFVMELVRGSSLTEFCDAQTLGTRERLHLFVEVCRAVQHAHQKGIIHRDLKPSNIMVTMRDDRAIPKVIDFGVAKAVSQKLTEKTVYTGYGQLVGTPLYMSPEQAQMNEVDVDTRSDVYSLGILLYELLTGTTPFDGEMIKQASFDELRRIIREDEPPRPSERISTLKAEMLSTVADRRKIDGSALARSLRGELDWIVMKALEKDRNRRYESASAFAADIERYLHDELIQARPPSTWYRIRKLVRRRRSVVAMSVTMTAALFIGVGSIGWSIRDLASRKEAAVRQKAERQIRLAEQVERHLGDANQLMRESKWSAALSCVRRAEATISGGDADQHTRLRVRDLLNDLELVQRLDRVRQLNTAWAVSDFAHKSTVEAFAAAFGDYGIPVTELPDEQVVARLQSRPLLVVPFALALDDWAGGLNQMRKRSEARRLLVLADTIDPHPWRSQVREALLSSGPDVERDKLLRKLAANAPVGELAASSFWLLTSELRHHGYAEEARNLLKRAQSVYPDDFWINFDLATFYDIDQQPESQQQAATFYRVALAIRPHNPAAWNGLGGSLIATGQAKEGIACYQRAITFDPQFAPAWVNLGNAFADRNELDRAIEHYRKAIALAPQHPLAYARLGEALRRQGRLQEAIRAFEESLELDPQSTSTHNNLGLALYDAGMLEQAIEHLQTAIEIDPNYVGAYTNLGNALTAAKRFEEAADSYKQAIRLDSRFVAAHYNLGVALMKAGRLDEAAVSWKAAIAIDPQSHRPECVQAYNNLGVYRAKNDDFEGACDYWRKSLDLQPADQHVREYLVSALLERASQLADQHDLQGVRESCREALQLTKDEPRESLQRLRGEAEQLLKTTSETESPTRESAVPEPDSATAKTRTKPEKTGR